MGLFSYLCEGCQVSIKAPFGLKKKHAWMNECVAVLENGSILKGEYDGYGKVDGIDLNLAPACWWHKECWDMACREEREFDGPSIYAEDQGYFDNLDDED